MMLKGPPLKLATFFTFDLPTYEDTSVGASEGVKFSQQSCGPLEERED